MEENTKDKGDPFPQRTTFTRYNYSFSARLIQSPPKVQAYYAAIMAAVRGCALLRLTHGWRQVYIHVRRRQVAQMVFKGRTLCIALALDPAEYAGSKHHVEDVSRYKRFAKTPLLVRLVSRLRLRSALALLERAAGVPALPRAALPAEPLCSYKTTEELIGLGLVKVLSRTAAEEEALEAEREALFAEEERLIRLQSAAGGAEMQMGGLAAAEEAEPDIAAECADGEIED